MILVISHPADEHATGVLDAVSRRGHKAVLVDTAQFPRGCSLTERFGGGATHYELTIDEEWIDLDECGAGWWRRPQPFTLHEGISPQVLSFTYAECHEAVAGLWAALDLSWVNPPELDELAHHKPYQLAVAHEVGLPIPLTSITNDPAEAERFVAQVGIERVVYKTFLASEEHWRETRILQPHELAILDRVRLAPVIFQEFVPATADIRATVVGERVFATAISPAPGGYDLDYRIDLAHASFEPTELAADTNERIGELMRRLGLLYGAIDLRRMPTGEEVFLEVNPAGEWLFVEERSGQPITDALAELLIELDGQGS